MPKGVPFHESPLIAHTLTHFTRALWIPKHCLIPQDRFKFLVHTFIESVLTHSMRVPWVPRAPVHNTCADSFHESPFIGIGQLIPRETLGIHECPFILWAPIDSTNTHTFAQRLSEKGEITQGQSMRATYEGSMWKLAHLRARNRQRVSGNPSSSPRSSHLLGGSCPMQSHSSSMCTCIYAAMECQLQFRRWLSSEKGEKTMLWLFYRLGETIFHEFLFVVFLVLIFYEMLTTRN